RYLSPQRTDRPSAQDVQTEKEQRTLALTARQPAARHRATTTTHQTKIKDVAEVADSSNLALTGRAVPVSGPAQMQAARLEQPQTITVTEQQIPQPGPGEVRVRLEGCGVCASSLPLWEGRPWFHYPIEPGTPGHEGWGYVDAVGAEVRDLPVGQRVAVLSQHAFAQYDIAPAQSVIPLPAELDHQPFPGEAIGCAMNIFRRSEDRKSTR